MAGSPVVSRQVAPDRYWQLRHLVSEAVIARQQSIKAHELLVAAQQKVDAAVSALGLDPAQAYRFTDDGCLLTPESIPDPIAPAAPVPAPIPALAMLEE
jgi:hypothetical protein